MKRDPNKIVALWCPYCGKQAMITPAWKIYGTKYTHLGSLYACPGWPGCDSYVGCHKGTLNPLGRMANAELRKAKSAAHRMFDALWKHKVANQGIAQKVARGLAYSWLASELKIDREKCHIGMMDVEQCRAVVAACAPYFKTPAVGASR